jgi:hypothetical protein
MTTASSESAGLDWGLGSFLLRGAFANLAQGLRWMFWGLVLEVAGGGLLLSALAARHGLPRQLLASALLVGGGTWMAGSLFLIWGEQKCLHLKLPLGYTDALPGRDWLRGAYWCHMGGILARLLRGVAGKGPLRWVTLPVTLLGFVFLLLFLRRIAGAIVRLDLVRLIDAIFLMSAGAAGSGALLVLNKAAVWGLVQALGRPAGAGLVLLPLVLAVGTVVSYAILLWRMSFAAAEMAQFLASAEIPLPDADAPAASEAVSLL